MTELAIAHDQFRTMGGAERVAVALARTFDAPIYAARVDEGVPPDDVTVREVFDGRVSDWAMQSHSLVQDAYQMLAWQHVPELHAVDTVIVNKTNPAWYVPKDTQTVLWYLHSTPRGLYDQFHQHGAGIKRAAISGVMRTLYGGNRLRPDLFVCNSELVQRRAERYFGVDRTDPRSRVVYPPVDTDGLDPSLADTGNYYLVLGRLRDHKCVAEAIRAADEVGVPLHIAGDGPQRAELARLAKTVGIKVTFHGYVDERRKARLLAGAKALVMPAENEDFGLTPVEALASGTPVVGVREGYTRHQVVDGETGILYDRDGGAGLAAAIERFEREGVAASAAELTSVAQQCATGRFREAMRAAVDDARQRSRVTADWAPDAKAGADNDEALAVTDGGDAE